MASTLRGLLDAHAHEGKALGYHPGFVDPGRPVGVWDLNNWKNGNSPSRGMTGAPRKKQEEAKRHTEAYAGKNAMDWVSDCVRFTAETVSNADYHFEAKPKSPPTTRIPGDPVAPPQNLHDLLEQPNPYMDYMEMMELLVIDLLLVGNAYLFKWRPGENGRPLALYRLAPPYVEVGAKPWGIGSYDYQIPNSDKLEMDPENVIHFKMPNPDSENPYYGKGLISAGGRAADLDIALVDSQASYFENHAMPSMVLESQRRVPRDVFKKIRAQLHARAAGSRNSGELLTLEAGLKLASVAPTAVQAAFLELSKASRDRIFAWFRINPKLLGITDEKSNDKLADVQRHFDNNTARPLMNKIQKKLSTSLSAAWDLNYIIDYEYQLDPEEQAKLGAAYAPLPGIRVDELRKVAGLGPHPDKTIGDITLNLPGEDGGGGGPGETSSENGFPDRNLASEPGRPPKGENTKAFPKGAKARRSGETQKALADALDEIGLGHLVEGPIYEETLEDALAQLNALGEKAETNDPGAPAEDTLLERRHEEVDSVRDFLSKELGVHAMKLGAELAREADEGKAEEADKTSKAWKKFKEGANEAIEAALSKIVSAAAVHHAEVGVRPDGEVDYAPIVAAVAKGKYGAVAFSNTLKKELTKAVNEAKKEGASPSGALLNAINDWIAQKAPMIAETTAQVGYNEATLEVSKAAGITKFIVSDGVDDDEPCVAANGETWSLAECQASPIEHPRCRRAFVPVVADTIEE